MWKKLLDVEIIRNGKGFYSLRAYLKVREYNKMYQDNYLSTVWPKDESLFKIDIKVVRNKTFESLIRLESRYRLYEDDVVEELFYLRNFLYLRLFESMVRDFDTVEDYNPKVITVDHTIEVDITGDRIGLISAPPLRQE